MSASFWVLLGTAFIALLGVFVQTILFVIDRIKQNTEKKLLEKKEKSITDILTKTTIKQITNFENIYSKHRDSLTREAEWLKPLCQTKGQDTVKQIEKIAKYYEKSGMLTSLDNEIKKQSRIFLSRPESPNNINYVPETRAHQIYDKNLNNICQIEFDGLKNAFKHRVEQTMPINEFLTYCARIKNILKTDSYSWNVKRKFINNFENNYMNYVMLISINLKQAPSFPNSYSEEFKKFTGEISKTNEKYKL